MTERVTKPTPLPLRNDTILGVCEALGQDFGFNPLWLRLAFIAPLFWQPALTVAVYIALGVVIAVSRYVFPKTVVRMPADKAQPEIADGDDLKIAA